MKNILGAKKLKYNEIWTEGRGRNMMLEKTVYLITFTKYYYTDQRGGWDARSMQHARQSREMHTKY